MRLIPGRTKVQIELFRGITVIDVAVGGVGLTLILLVLGSGFSNKLYVCIGVLLLFGALLMRMDSEPIYVYLLHLLRHYAYKHDFVKGDDEAETAKKASPIEEIMPYTGIKDGVIEYGGNYFGSVIEIPPVEFRFFSTHRRNNSIENGLGRVLRSLDINLGGNIVKIERPMIYDDYVRNEFDKIDALRLAYEQGMLKEDEMQTRVEVIYDRIKDLDNMNKNEKIIEPAYYLVLYAENKTQLELETADAINNLKSGELLPKRLNDKELAVFLRYVNEIDFDEREVENVAPEDYVAWSYPRRIKMTPRKVEVNHMITHNYRIVRYPSTVGDAWLAGPLSMPGTKVVIKFKPTDSTKAIRGIDRSLQELRGQYMATSVDSKLMEIQNHIDTLSTLLSMLKGENECLLDTNVFISIYDHELTQKNKLPGASEKSDRVRMTSMKKAVRKLYQESSFGLNGMDFNQVPAFIGSQISAYDPFIMDGRGMPSNTIGAMYPWIFAAVNDKNGFKIGNSSGSPVFVDFFRRDSERVNSNMVIIGKSGSGKSYATKSLLTNLAADDSKIFILDPENEYTDLADNLHGKFINVGNAQYGRLNPFHIITALSDEDSDGPSGSYATHLQFLEEFFKQVLPDCDKDALEYLNSLIDRTYFDKGITPFTDLSQLQPEDYPIFDDLYDEILKDFQQTDNEYLRRMLRTLVNYVSKFASGGRNANIWNGPATVTTEENFTVFNFQSLLANRNGTIANAQMLLVLKYIDNEIIKNRDYNIRYGCNRKIIVVIDEAHVFIDAKFPIALDFMFQLAKRIRKYNGMQIVITQNIKDFVGSEELARKSTAIINACQYSFIFSLAPNDMSDLCTLYEKAGGISETEQEQIISAARGQAFVVMSPTSRSTFHVDVPDGIVNLFSSPDYRSSYFSDENGQQTWEDFMGDSTEKREANILARLDEDEEEYIDAGGPINRNKESFSFVEISEEDSEIEKQSIASEEDDEDDDATYETKIGSDELTAKESISTELYENLQKEQRKSATAQQKLADITAELHENTKTLAKAVSVIASQPQNITVQDTGATQTAQALKDMMREFSDAVANMSRMNTETMQQLSGTVDSIGRMNYESIMESVSRLIEEKTQNLVAERQLQKLVQPDISSASESFDALQEEEHGGVSLGSIFDAIDTDDSDFGTFGTSTDSDDDISNDLNSLFSALRSIDSVSRIDMMDAFGEQRTEITFEELVEHISIHNLR